MESSNKMKILIIEDDVKDCESFKNAVNNRDDIEIVAITDSDTEGLQYVKLKHPEGIILDLELNNSTTGNTDSLNFLEKLKELNLKYEPIVIVTTHINSKRTYEILHKSGVELILYKDHPKYSSEHVLNNFISLRKTNNVNEKIMQKEITDVEKISKLIDAELDLIGVTAKLKGRNYIHDAILYLLQNENKNANAVQYLVKKYKKPSTTITNGIQNAIIHAWRVTPIEDIETYYKARINYETGVPTPMEFIYYYFEKLRKEI